MGRDDLKIDLSDIFGGTLTQEQKKAIEEKVAAHQKQQEEPEPPSAPVVSPRQEETIDFNAPIPPPFSTKLKEKLEVVPQAAEAAEIPAPPSEAQEASAPTPEELEEQRRIAEMQAYVENYESLRGVFLRELSEIVGEKKVYAMLERTYEAAREKYPQVLRNANWDDDGNLLEGGALNGMRIYQNKKKIDAEHPDQVIDAALEALLQLRLGAVEKALGTGMRSLMKTRLVEEIRGREKSAGASGTSPVFYRRLLAMLV